MTDIKDNFSASGMAYHNERDRKPIDIILMSAYQLGYSVAKIESQKEIDRLKEVIELERTFNRPNKKNKPHPKAVAKLTKLWEDNI